MNNVTTYGCPPWSWRTTTTIAAFICITVAISLGGCDPIHTKKDDSISNLSFSHDGKKVVFDRCRSEGCQIQVYDLATGELAAYQSPKNERWTMGRYAYDGKRIAFSIIPVKSGKSPLSFLAEDVLDLGNMQIAVMDADGKNFRKVTSGPGAKLYPVFSHNGKKILYACAAYIRESGGTPAANYDAWEVDLETGRQTRLTFHEYFYMGYLTYYPDDERFVYYGSRPLVYEDMRFNYMNEYAFGAKMVELERQGKGIHGVVVMKGKELIPHAYDFGEKVRAEKPLLSKDGSILLYEKSVSGGDFYLYSPDGNHRLVGQGGSVNSAAISPDGDFIGMITFSIHIFTVRDGKRKVILYLPSAPKTIENWEEAYRRNKKLYRMIPERPSHILNR